MNDGYGHSVRPCISACRTVLLELHFTHIYDTCHRDAYEAQASVAGGFAPDQNVNGSLLKGDTEQPEIQTYNVAIDQRWKYGIVTEIAYAGNRSSNLLNGSFIGQNIYALQVGALYGPQPNSRPDTAATAGTINSQEYTLLFNQTLPGADLNQVLNTARTSSTNFGTATYKTGRRIMEMSLRYEF